MAGQADSGVPSWRMMSKSKAAFLMSCEKLFEDYGTLYFWTFTFKEVHPDWYYSYAWARFMRAMQNLYGGMLAGVKVTELHQNHGIHYHCLLNRRVWVGEVRRIGKRHGIGRVHVRVAHGGEAKYLSKYMSKRETGGRVLSKYIRKWSTVGPFVGIKKRNVEVDCSMSRNVKKAQLCLEQKKVPFQLFKRLAGPDMDFQEVMGLCADSRLRLSRKVERNEKRPCYSVFGGVVE
jgi:hypothetical protein